MDEITKERLKACKEFAIGDRVKTDQNPHNLATFRLPSYLTSGVLTIVGFTKGGKVLCDWDGGKPFSIPPHLLKKIG